MMDELVKRYRAILKVGILLVVVSFFVGIWRLFNQVAIEEFKLLGDTVSEAYLAVDAIEAVLHAYVEIVPLFGLGILKLGIGFAIATIVITLRSTGENARASLAKINLKPPDPESPFFSRVFVKLLVLGILIELVAVLITIGWMVAEVGILDSGLAHIFEIFAEPLEGLGVAFLIGGIAFGLATIVLNLSAQSVVLPGRLIQLATGKESRPGDVRELFPKKILLTTYLGMIITVTGLFPLAFIRLFITIPLPTWENWMFIGIGTMLFSIVFWLLTIIKWLRAQRSNLGNAVAEAGGIEVPEIEPRLSITRLVPVLAVIGLLWMITFAGLGLMFSAGLVGQWGPLVRPGKAIGLATIFLGIGLALMTIVVNLKLTSFMLPGSFSKIASAIKGDKVEGAPGLHVENPLSLAPRKLYGGIVIGAIIAAMGTFPLALIRALSGPSSPLFLIVERMIGTTVGLGVGIIFFFIGLAFGTIVAFVSGRKTHDDL
ncbi:MAG: hypothetical protein ACW99G_11905 [Candidatus Thorarchaeota archaeon]|jgi:hypothetical protein